MCNLSFGSPQALAVFCSTIAESVTSFTTYDNIPVTRFGFQLPIFNIFFGRGLNVATAKPVILTNLPFL